MKIIRLSIAGLVLWLMVFTTYAASSGPFLYLYHRGYVSGPMYVRFAYGVYGPLFDWVSYSEKSCPLVFAYSGYLDWWEHQAQ